MRHDERPQALELNELMGSCCEPKHSIDEHSPSQHNFFDMYLNMHTTSYKKQLLLGLVRNSVVLSIERQA